VSRSKASQVTKVAGRVKAPAVTHSAAAMQVTSTTWMFLGVAPPSGESHAAAIGCTSPKRSSIQIASGDAARPSLDEVPRHRRKRIPLWRS
jgi:hypothetical protein